MSLRGFLTSALFALGLMVAALVIRPHRVILSCSRSWSETMPAAIPTVARPDINARAAYVADATTGQEFYAMNADTELPEASTTKIITATLAIQHGNLDRIVTCSKNACDTEPANIDMKLGEKISERDLLYAMMIHSANDAAVAVSEAVSGKESKFVALMNAYAKRLGCTHTHFVTPNGLNDPKHYTTARDLAKFAVYALKIPFFNQLIKTRKYKIKRSINKKYLVMRRGHGGDRFLFNYTGADGVKTGYTHQAGNCYVGSATLDDAFGPRRVLTVVFHGSNTFHDTEMLMDYGFKAWTRRAVVKKGADEGTLCVRGTRPAVGSSFHTASGIMMTLRADQPHRVEMRLAARAVEPARAGERVGYMEARVDGGKWNRIPLLLDRAVPPPAVWRRIQALRFSLGILSVLLLGTSYGAFAKAYRRRRALLSANGRGMDSTGPSLPKRPNGKNR